MVVSRWRWVISGLLLLGAGVGPLGSWSWAQSGPVDLPALEGPTSGAGTRPDVPRAGAVAAEAGAPLHEAFLAPGARADRVRAPKSPPPPVVEQPTTDRPSPDAQWVEGYWAWDPARADFLWVAGAWRVPPPGAIWVNGRWMRDDAGWYRVPGSWSRRQGSAVAASGQPGWRTTGPPADHPDDAPGLAPGPDYFFVPGHYTPEGDRVTWTPGFWARMQPGWDWVPAHWVRRPGGWDYREGYWTRDPASADVRRHTVTRPAAPDDAPGLPPPIVESEPARPDAGADRLPPPPDQAGRDPIAEAEENARAANPSATAPGVDPPVVVLPEGGPYVFPYPPVRPPLGYGYRYGYGYRMPYSVIRPPGYPYGPAGVVVPAAVPPFVQRLLDRVLP